ncbi:MAG TPA: hypothetical protein IAA26_08525 [Candidatus Blautia faecipullorum]|nr:hypothetical protein [Candidatus Blautia faecipullorum]
MINVSNEFKTTMAERTDFNPSASFTFQDGRTLALTDKDFSISNNMVTDGAESRSFPLGVAVGRSIQLEITNYEDQYADYDFNMAVIRLKLNFQLSETTESIDFGKYTVTEPENYGSIITIQAVDDMYKANKEYDTALSFPASLGSLVADSCAACGIDLQTAAFKNDDFLVQKKPENITHRQFYALAAMLAGGYARMNRQGRLCINSYNFSGFEESVTDINVQEVTPASNYHIFKSFISSPNIATDDVVITGIQAKGEDQDYIYGEEGYVLEIDNPLIEGKEQTAVSLIGESVVGCRFRPFTADYIAYPVAEFGDICYLVDRNQNVFQSILTDICFTFYGITTLKCAADSPLRNSSKMNSEAVKTLLEAKKNTEKVFSAYDTAVQTMNQIAANTFGFFSTTVKQPDGSILAYRHDKPALAESKVVYKLGIDGFWTTRDYQGTDEATEAAGKWKAGFDSSGNAVLNILSVIGINFDWATGGAIRIEDEEGNAIFSADMDTKQVLISGDSVRIGGKTATAAINDVLDDSKEYADGKLADYANTVSGDLAALQAQVDGQVEDWYYDYEPSMQNYPAAEWTTNEERIKHIGDRFFWKSKGYAYRFMETDGVWGWVLLKDTDITSAMQAAQEAQDTADGKRRTFVVTPQPPYDIGDLWCNGEDILTCGVARAQGSVFVSADWQKLNNYTDDTVANEALDEAKKARNLNMILDNEYQGIPADHEGNISTFPVVQTGVQVFYGSTDVSASCSYSIAKSGSVTGSWDNTLRTYTVTGLSADTGWVDITASYLGLFSATKRFNVQKVRDGAKGEDGIPGEAGKGIKSTTVTYQASSSGITVPTGTWSTEIPSVSANQYLWTRTVIIYTDNTTSTSYSIGKMGATGAKGDKGDKGDTGAAGAAGNGISGIAEHYAVSSSNTTAPTSWSSTPPTMTATNKYLWNYETITYTNGTTTDTAKRVIGAYGNTGSTGAAGATGKGIKSVVNYYLASASSSGVTTSTSGWTTTIQTITTSKKYLWNYEVITYTDNSATTTTPCIIGVYGNTGATGAKGDKGDKGDTGAAGEKGDKGDTGATGKGIKSVVNYYLASASASGVTTSTSGWTTTIQTISTSKKYLWNYEKITYTDNTTSSTTPCIIGVYGNTGATGATGAAGKGISSITEYYLASASASGVTTSTSGWTTTMQTTTTTKKYLWNYEKITYTDGTTSNTTVRIIGTHGTTGATGAKGDKGDTGATGAAGKGVKSTAVTYQASSSGTTIPTGTWSTAIPSVSAGSYLWTRTVITYTDNTTSVSYSVGKMGNTGTAARTYFIEPSVNVLKRGRDNAVYPNTLGFSAYYRDGNSTTRTAYSGRFVIEKTTDGKTWTEIYRSSQNESSVTHTLTGISKDVVQIRAKLYAAGGTTTLMDIQSVAVVTDVDALTPLEVLELASQGMEGIYSPDGIHFYFSASAIKSGIMQGIEILSKSDNDWMRMYQSLLTGGYGSTTDGLLDLSANYADGRHVVLESKTGDVILKSKNEIKVERQSGTMGYLVQSGTPGLVEGDTIIIENDVQPVVLIGWDEDSDAMYLRLKNETSKYLYPQSSVGGYVLAGYQIITLDTGGQSISSNGTSATDTVTISANLRDASYSYTYQLIETGWLTPASVTWSGNPYYQLSCKFLNTGSYSHSGSAKFIVYAWKNR